jgi:2-polyprenyl-3-methyl-5-hydroxy-6-metoxy-1,4-benzoquinol methylase
MKNERIKKKISEFYNNNPFPGLDLKKIKNCNDLIKLANPYGILLSKQIKKKSFILDIGCGTGKNSCLLSGYDRKILGIDISKNSIKKANELKNILKIENTFFKNIDLYELEKIHKFKEQKNKFDYIICIGVLHHSKNIKKAMTIISNLIKDDGYLIIGLYNNYGRLITKVKQILNKISFGFLENFDYFVLNIANNDEEKKQWIKDMYHCPYEKTYSLNKIIQLINTNNFEFINSFPNNLSFNKKKWPIESQNLFKKHKIGSKTELFFLQLKWIFTEHKIGGLINIIAKKKSKIKK